MNAIVISIINAPETVAPSETSKTIGTQGGSIGRNDDNLWVLDDPERFLSGRHCEFSFENGEFYITDLSTNGTFYNGSADPMGKGSKQPVHDQDRFIVGDYEFSIQLKSDSATPLVSDGLAASPFDDELASPSSASEFAGSPFASGLDAGSDVLMPGGAQETDPLQALDKAGSEWGGENAAVDTVGEDLFTPSTQNDHADPLNQQLDWPQPAAGSAASASDGGFSGVIPDDWDDDAVDTAAPPPAQQVVTDELAEINVRLEAEIERLQQQVSALKQQLEQQPASPTKSGQISHSVIDAMGLDASKLDDEEIERINQQVGEAIRETVQGLMQVLGSRSAIKNEFRMNVTTIQPVENNPLKFSANLADALDNMFLKQGNAYKKPVEAVRASFDDIAEHQVAVLAGIREAFKVLVDRFDPLQLEERFAKQQKGSLLLGSQKARNWEAYGEYFNELAGDIDKSFQYLFGDGFVRAYEDQLQKLAISRKSKKHTTQE